MTTMKPLLRVSIAANFILLAAFLATRSWVDSPLVVTAPKPPNNSLQTHLIPKPLAGTREKQPITSPPPEETNLSTYADQLLALGIPEPEVAELVFGRLHRVFYNRFELTLNQKDDTRYRLPYDFGQNPQQRETEKTILERQALRRDFRDQLADILGEKWRYQTRLGNLSFHNPELEFLPLEKQAALNDLRELFYLHDQGSPTGGPMQSEKKSLHRQYQDDIAATLSPAELEQYNYRFSTEAISVRSRLSQMNPSEEEFRVVYEIADRYGADAIRKLESEDLASELRSRLGADRYRELVVTQDHQYKQLKKAAHERGYSMEQTLSLGERKLDMQQERRRIAEDFSISSSDKRKKLIAIRDKVIDMAKDILDVDISEDLIIAEYLHLQSLQIQIDRLGNE